MKPNKIIKLLIVDDSPVSCKLLQFIAESDPEIKVIGTCSNGLEAIEFLKQNQPDVILMDIHMPRIDGFETTRRIMSTKPVPIIICSVDYSPKDTEKSFRALEVGALAILEKPPAITSNRFNQSLKTFVDTIKNVSEIKLITRKSVTNDIVMPSVPKVSLPENEIDAIAIGASLGGPQALQAIFSGMKPHFPFPIFIAQHIAADFAEGLATWLKSTTGFNFVVPKQGEFPEAGKIYLAPGCSNMTLTKEGNFNIEENIEEDKISSSISSLFISIADYYKSRAVGIILTGMGRDGVDGLKRMKEIGALTIAQSAEDCMMFGMPKEAIKNGAATISLNLKEIPTYLQKLLYIPN